MSERYKFWSEMKTMEYTNLERGGQLIKLVLCINNTVTHCIMQMRAGDVIKIAEPSQIRQQFGTFNVIKQQLAL